MDVRPAAMKPVADRPVARLEGDAGPRDRLGREGPDLERLGIQPRRPADHARLERENDDRGLEARIQAHDLARLDDQSGFLERLANRRFADRLVDLAETPGLSPPAATRIDPASEENDPALRCDRDRRDDEPRVDVCDIAA